MFGWLERKQQRNNELSQGVDADLVRDNRKRWKQGFWFLVCGFVLLGIQTKFRFSGPWHYIAVGITMVCFASGLFLWTWARAEWAFLNRPSPKEPPKLV